MLHRRVCRMIVQGGDELIVIFIVNTLVTY